VRVTPDPAPTIVVVDTGCGIEEADLCRVFDRFYKADRSRTHVGTIRSGGLGLAICKSLVEGAGGSIEVASSRGRGTVVTVTLPPVMRCG
jgi:two-component system sensor histidine kinase BaeS